MGTTTKIAWTDRTASPWHGCAHAKLPDGSDHPGCLNCYAEAMSRRNPSTLGEWGDDGTRVKSKSFIDKLHRWNREAESAGKTISVFPSICDPFEDRPELEPWRAEMFAAIDECPNVTVLLLTKRPENIRRMTPARCVGVQPIFPGAPGKLGNAVEAYSFYWPNAWLGTSVSNQATADLYIPALLKCRELSPALFVSAEPLLARIRFADVPGLNRIGHGPGINQVIIGVESSGRRVGRLGEFTSEADWIERGARPIVRQCQAAGVACFVKQIPVNGKVSHDPDEWPEDLRLREFPKPAV